VLEYIFTPLRSQVSTYLLIDKRRIRKEEERKEEERKEEERKED
jgi:hypothetical protein